LLFIVFRSEFISANQIVFACIMNNKAKIIISAISLIITLQTPAQDTLNNKTVFPSGIFIGYGQGLYSVKDEYISKEKYSGTIPYYSVEWVRFQKRNGYRLEFEYWKTTDISNNKISAETQQAIFNQDFIYPIGNFSLFSRNVYAYLGPSVQIFYYEIYYHFVSPGTFISPTTNGIMGSLGVNTEFIYQVNSKLNIEASLRSNLISFTGKAVDEQKYADDSSPVLLSVFTATKFDFDLSVRYYLLKRISISLAYKFDLSRINKWDPYIAASDNIIISLNFKLRS
jgi:hypothetical protein